MLWGIPICRVIAGMLADICTSRQQLRQGKVYRADREEF